MAKHKSIRREIAEMKAKVTREANRKEFNTVCEKSRVETYRDVVGVFFGLSRKAIEAAALSEIIRLAHLGFSPDKIVKYMEGNDKK